MSLLWHEHRKGRITTSLFGQVCHTSIENPSKSLVNTFIKQPLIHSPALTWVLKMKIQLSRNTTNWFQQSTLMSLSRIGLYINPSYPHLDASPDALIRVWMLWKRTRGNEVSLQHPQWWSKYFQKIFLPCRHTYGKQLDQKSNCYYQIQSQLWLYVTKHIVTSPVGY